MTLTADRRVHFALPDLAEVIGWEAVGKLVHAMGGQRIYVPRRFPADHPVVQAIGEESAAVLASGYHLTMLYFPSSLRREAIVRAALARSPQPTISQIAEEACLSYEGVRKIITRIESGQTISLGQRVSNNRQLDLFDHI